MDKILINSDKFFFFMYLQNKLFTLATMFIFCLFHVWAATALFDDFEAPFLPKFLLWGR